MIKADMSVVSFDGTEEIIRAELAATVSAYRKSLIRRHGFSSRKATENIIKLLTDAIVISEASEGEDKIVQFKKRDNQASD